MKRVLTATLAGGFTFFLLGGLIYVVLLGGFYEANLGSATGVLREQPIGWALVLSQLGLGGLVTYVFVRAEVATALDGLKAGAAFGLLFGIAMALDLYAVTNWSNLTVALVEPFVTAARMAVAGAVIGWVLGLGRDC